MTERDSCVDDALTVTPSGLCAPWVDLFRGFFGFLVGESLDVVHAVSVVCPNVLDLALGRPGSERGVTDTEDLSGTS